MALASFSAARALQIRTLPFSPRRSTRACLSRDPSVRSPLLGLRNDPPGRRSWTRRSAAPEAPRCTHSAGAGEGDRQPLENIVKLYTAMKEGNVHQVSDLIGLAAQPPGAEEGDRRPLGTVLRLYTAVKNGTTPFFGPDSEAKKRVQQLFSYLVGLTGNNVEFLIKPTRHGGTDVGIAWRLDWKNTHKPMAGDSSFHTVHYYQGKMFLRNVEMLAEPIVHIHLLGRKLVEKPRSALRAFDEKGRVGFMISLLLLLLMGFCFVVVKKLPL